MATITIEQAKHISSLEHEKAHNQLRIYLKWEEYDKEDELQKDIHLDYLYDTLLFTIKKGFPWAQACAVLQLSADILENAKGKTLLETITLFKETCLNRREDIGENYLKTYSDYFFSTFMQHHKLYQYVFTQEQDKNIVAINLQVETPPIPQDFKDGKDFKIWEYEKKLESFDEIGEKRKKERQEQSIILESGNELLIEKAYQSIENAEKPLQKEHILMLINEVAHAHLTATTHKLKLNVESTLDKLDLMLEKTCLPRPPELGPPTRYQTKIPSGVSSRKKSAKERKTSSRISKR